MTDVVTDEFVAGDPLAAKAVAADGTVLPVSVGAIEFARSDEWSKWSGLAEFNSVFYSAVANPGAEMQRARDEVALVLAHRVPFRMTQIQCKVAYGFERGVIGRHGRFNPSKLNGTDWEVKLMEARARTEKRVSERFSAADWDRIETDALAACMGLADQVDIAIEFRWIRKNLHQAPYFKDAPSQGAIKDWLTVMKPGNESLLRDFTNLAWSKRLSPGDRKSKSAFKEDAEAEAGELTAEETAERYRKLFGGL